MARLASSRYHATVTTTIVPVVWFPVQYATSPTIMPAPAIRFRAPTTNAHILTSSRFSVWTARNFRAVGCP